MAEGGGAGPDEQERRASRSRPPSARDLQLALAELYEDEVKCKTSKSGRPKATVFKSPRTPPQRFYSGEHEYSGLHIVQPPTGKIVNELFKEAKEHGAVPLNEAARSSSDDKAKSFTGGGYRLGNSFCKRSEYIYGENQLQDVQILLKLWSNGFSLDDGELRPYSDPTNAQFLESVKRGEIPPELQRLVHGGQVNLDMEDHQDQEYIKPRLRFKAFSGEGQKLGRVSLVTAHLEVTVWTRVACLCLPRTGIKGSRLHAQRTFVFFKRTALRSFSRLGFLCTSCFIFVSEKSHLVRNLS